MTADTRALDAEILHLKIRLAGRELERAMALGQRAVAEGFRVQMYDLITQRQDAELAKAEARGECFFAVAGDLDGQAIAETGALRGQN